MSKTIDLELTRAEVEVLELEARLRVVPMNDTQLSDALKTALAAKKERLAKLRTLHATAGRASRKEEGEPAARRPPAAPEADRAPKAADERRQVRVLGSPSGASRHLPMNGEERGEAAADERRQVRVLGSPSGASRHLPMNGEETFR
ncbi:MAG: hypothetical protein E6I81_01230 [Chloroflexi bacterium]|nr:MAG: hypothetical protein E6I81_01230 [Chloroflexota bacterium]